MKILVTGAGGFIGSHVTHACLADGHAVRALVHYNAQGSYGHLAQLPPELTGKLDVRLGDVTDPFMMQTLVEGCDAVLHLAALIGIPYSYAAPASYVATNVTGTLNILEAARQAQTQRIVVTSTSEVYGTAQETPMREDHPLQAQSPYAATKIAADKLAESYYRSFDLPVVILRPFNTYGPRQSSRAIIPAIFVQLLSGAKALRLGNLDAKRDLTFVSDTARAFVLAATTPEIEGQTIHFGNGTMVSIRELAELSLQVAGRDAEIVSTRERMRPEKSEVGVLLCDPTRASERLGWAPRTTLKEGLGQVHDYLRDHLNAYRSDDYVT